MRSFSKNFSVLCIVFSMCIIAQNSFADFTDVESGTCEIFVGSFRDSTGNSTQHEKFYCSAAQLISGSECLYKVNDLNIKILRQSGSPTQIYGYWMEVASGTFGKDLEIADSASMAAMGQLSLINEKLNRRMNMVCNIPVTKLP